MYGHKTKEINLVGGRCAAEELAGQLLADDGDCSNQLKSTQYLSFYLGSGV